MRPINSSRNARLSVSSQFIRVGTLVVPILLAGCSPNTPQTSQSIPAEKPVEKPIAKSPQTTTLSAVEKAIDDLVLGVPPAIAPTLDGSTGESLKSDSLPAPSAVETASAMLSEPVAINSDPVAVASEPTPFELPSTNPTSVAQPAAEKTSAETSTSEKVRIRFANSEPGSPTSDRPASFELVSASSDNGTSSVKSPENAPSSSDLTSEKTLEVSSDPSAGESQDGKLVVNDRKTTVQINEESKKPVPPSKTPSSIVVASEAEKNQVIAADWPAPWAAFYITGQQYGYLEPCGCTGLENQKGGINRRDTLLKQILDRGWEVFPIDAGNQVRRTGRQSEIKYQKTVEAFRAMNYRAVGLGPHDLNLSFTELLLTLFNDRGDVDSPFVSANVVIHDQSYMDRFKIIRAGNRKIAITSVLGDDMRKAGGVLASDLQSIEITAAVDSLKATKKLIDVEKCDYTILIAHTSLEESAKLAQSVPGFDLVITAGGYGEPTYKPEPIEGTKSLMVQVGTKGMYAGLFALYDDANTPFRYQRIALSSQFEDSPRMTELFKRYQNLLKETGFQRLGLRPQTHASNNEFVGSQKCGECHTTAFDLGEDTSFACHGFDHLSTSQKRYRKTFRP